MGCDIHMMAEKRVDGAWRPIDDVTLCDDRHYDLFAILANVRNGAGFEGVQTGDGFVPICEPRGIPEDASPEYLEFVDQYRCDGHSHSFHTVRQIMEYDWTQTTKKRGVVTLRQWARYKVDGEPENYSGRVGGAAIKIATLDEVEDAFARSKLDIWQIYHEKQEALNLMGHLLGVGSVRTGDFSSNLYTAVSWQIPYYRAGRDLLGQTLPQLWRRGSPDDTRIVFYFDN